MPKYLAHASAAHGARRLPALLRQLHRELERAPSLDPESQRLLRVVAEDLERLRSPVSSTLALAARFEADHPGVAATLRQIADTIAKAGI